jgi:hypothetical protein
LHPPKGKGRSGKHEEKEGKQMFPCTIASSSAPLLHRRIFIYDVDEVRISIMMKLYGSMLSCLSSQNFH